MPLTPFDPEDGYSDRGETELAKLFNIREMSEVLRKSESQIRRLVKKGRLPRPIYIGDTPLWPKEVIQSWLRRQIEGGGA